MQKPNSSLPCPQCGYIIQITLQDMLSKNDVTCARCGLVLKMDKPVKHSEALDRLEELKNRNK